MRKGFLLLICVIFGFAIISVAQDIHFSQFYSTPLQTSPANAGHFDGDWRVVANNKNQWNSFTKAYRTFAVSVDYSHHSLFYNDDNAGIGIILNRDIAGDGKFGTTHILLAPAYYFPFLKSRLLVGAGFALGYARHSVNVAELRFGSQYYNDQYNNQIQSGEVWTKPTFGYFDCSIGTNIVFRLNDKWSAETGFSLAHLNKPRKTFLDNNFSRLPMKWIIHATASVNIKDNFWLEPMFYSMVQQKYLEFDVGFLSHYDVNPLNLQAIYFGIFARTSDAGILCLGVKYHNVRFIVNYDINLSKLTRISGGNGGIEFSLIYIFAKPNPIETPFYRKCPDFL